MKKGRKGFTIIELVISMVIIGIIGSVVALYNLQAFRSWVFADKQSRLTVSTRNALYRMVREIKGAKTPSGILIWDPSVLSFRDTSDAIVTYSQSGTRLYRGADVIAEDLTDPGGLSFGYYNNAGAPALIKNDIRVISIRLSTQSGNCRFNTGSAARIRIN